MGRSPWPDRTLRSSEYRHRREAPCLYGPAVGLRGLAPRDPRADTARSAASGPGRRGWPSPLRGAARHRTAAWADDHGRHPWGERRDASILRHLLQGTGNCIGDAQASNSSADTRVRHWGVHATYKSGFLSRNVRLAEVICSVVGAQNVQPHAAHRAFRTSQGF
jgi:hypothetical protein